MKWILFKMNSIILCVKLGLITLNKKKKIVIKCCMAIISMYYIHHILYRPIMNTNRFRETMTMAVYRKSGNPWYLTNKKQLLFGNIPKPISSTTIKHIFYQNPPKWETGYGHYLFSGCPVTACEIHLGHKSAYSPSMDAVVFSANAAGAQPFPVAPRPVNQIWVFSASEPPYNCILEAWTADHWKNQINWTMTYRLDSEIKYIYGNPGRALDNRHALNHFQNIASNKTKLVAWVVSNCFTQSHREVYVDELSKYIPVDVFGFCGSGETTEPKLFDKIEMEYKFYLSFENSLCLDYVTEKLFRIQYKNIVTIVRGGANYTQYFPPDTFINVNDFKSPRQLANYLLHLDQNPEMYVQYLTKKAEFKESAYSPHHFCQLCIKLHEPILKSTVYQDVYEWWTRKVCRTPTDVNMDTITYIKLTFKFIRLIPSKIRVSLKEFYRRVSLWLYNANRIKLF